MRDAPIPKKNISSLIRGIRFVRKMKCVQSKLSKVIQDLCGGLGKKLQFTAWSVGEPTLQCYHFGRCDRIRRCQGICISGQALAYSFIYPYVLVGFLNNTATNFQFQNCIFGMFISGREGFLIRFFSTSAPTSDRTDKRTHIHTYGQDGQGTIQYG